MILFFDSSAFVKYFHEEPGTDVVTHMIENEENELYISELAKIEFFSALYRRFRNHEIREEILEQVLNDFDKQLDSFYIEPLGHMIIEEAEQLLKKYAKTYGLRTLDSLQLATFNLIASKEWSFVSTDEKLCVVAKEIGYHVVNPLKINMVEEQLE